MNKSKKNLSDTMFTESLVLQDALSNAQTISAAAISADAIRPAFKSLR